MQRGILYRVQVLAPMVLKPRPIPIPVKIGDLFVKRQKGIFRLHVRCANTQWTSGILLQFHKDLARMNGTPQPNRKLMLALGIEQSLV